MSRDEIRRAVHAIVAACLEGEPASARAEDALGALALDSLKQLELVIELENRFAICLDPDDEGELRTLEDVVRLIERRLMGAERGA